MKHLLLTTIAAVVVVGCATNHPELFDMDRDQGETKNLAAKHPELVAKFTKACITWHKSLPPDNGPQLAGEFRRNPSKTTNKK